MIWNYTTYPGSLELRAVKQLGDLIMAVALHPSGFYAVIAHVDRVKIYTIHPDDVICVLFEYQEVRGCNEIKFSNGGHLYAINDD
jgi:hypothetical protein